MLRRATLLIFAVLLFCCPGSAESGADAWLRYSSLRQNQPGLPHLIAVVGKGQALKTAANELVRTLGQEPSRQGPAQTLPLFSGTAGSYGINTQYFDQDNGASRYQILVNDRPVDSWAADDHLPSDDINGDTSTRHTSSDIELHPGDILKIVGQRDGKEPAPLDYLELIPPHN